MIEGRLASAFRLGRERIVEARLIVEAIAGAPQPRCDVFEVGEEHIGERGHLAAIASELLALFG